MKKVFLLGFILFSGCMVYSQNQQTQVKSGVIDRNNLQIRPNSRDYTMVRRGDNHQRILQIRSNALMLRRQAILNRQKAMERRRNAMQNRMIRQQLYRQRLLRQRGINR